MAYQSKAEKLRRSSYRFTHKLYSTTSVTKENPYTGIEYTISTRSEPRWCALYNTSLSSTTGVLGYDAHYDFQVAVRKIANDPFDEFTLDSISAYQFDDDEKTKYFIKDIKRATEPNGYHIITMTTHAGNMA